VLARRQRVCVFRGLTRGLRDRRIGILLRRRALLVDGSGRPATQLAEIMKNLPWNWKLAQTKARAVI
jgi:hypothetical protein